jgi:thiol-disulfide isomerase/thioredoxin
MKYIALCFSMLLSFTALTHAADGWKAGDKAPSLADFGLEGKLPALAGKVVYLDFWASWCSPCKASFPVLSGWQTAHAKDGLVVLAVNVDEVPADMNSFLEKMKLSFSIARDAKHSLVSAANVGTMPTSFLIDRKGVIRMVHNGFRKGDAAELEEKINGLLSEK